MAENTAEAPAQAALALDEQDRSAPEAAPAPTAPRTPAPLPTHESAMAAPVAAPVAVADPQPEEPTPGVDLTQLDALQEKYEQAVKRLDERTEVVDRYIRSERIKYLRSLQISPALTDAQVEALAPAADPTTPEGRAALDAFCEANAGTPDAPGLFTRATATPRLDFNELTEGVPVSRTFGKDLLIKTLERMVKK